MHENEKIELSDFLEADEPLDPDWQVFHAGGYCGDVAQRVAVESEDDEVGLINEEEIVPF